VLFLLPVSGKPEQVGSMESGGNPGFPGQRGGMLVRSQNPCKARLFSAFRPVFYWPNWYFPQLSADRRNWLDLPYRHMTIGSFSSILFLKTLDPGLTVKLRNRGVRRALKRPVDTLRFAAATDFVSRVKGGVHAAVTDC
jgi:hypothetical protein